MFRSVDSAISLLTCACLICSSSAAASDVGVVMSAGTVQVDGFEVPGTSVVFSGSRISSKGANSIVQFRDGTNATMQPGATMVVYGDHSVLEQGIALQHGIARHSVLANGLTISSKAPHAMALVGVKDYTHFEVAAQQGELEVTAPSGMALARIEPGTILSFDQEQNKGETTVITHLCGDLKENLQLTDVVTNVTYQLQGADIAKYVNSSIRVTGTISGPPSDSTPQIVVSSIAKLNHPCAMGAAVAPSAIAATGNKVPLIIVIAMGGTLLGLVLAGTFNGPSAPPPVPPQPPVHPYPPVTPTLPY
jgi:hypothetical protein